MAALKIIGVVFYTLVTGTVKVICWRTLFTDAFALHWIPYISQLAVINWRCTFTLTFGLFDEPYTAPFSVLASTEPITFTSSGPLEFHITSCCDTTVKISTGQFTTGFVSDGWLECVTFFFIVFVVRAIGTSSGRFFSLAFFKTLCYIACGQC